MEIIVVDYLFKIPLFYTGIVKLVRDDDKVFIKTLWYSDGSLHRVGEPAVIFPDGTEEWWFEGERHRKDGPAITWPQNYKEWWFRGENIYNSKWILNKPDLSSVSERHEFPLGQDYFLIERDVSGKGFFNLEPVKFVKILTQDNIGYIPMLPGHNIDEPSSLPST